MSATPGHVARVLEALDKHGNQGTPTEDPTVWTASCPRCGGDGLQVRDVDWDDHRRKLRLHCERCDEDDVRRELGLSDRDLLLDDKNVDPQLGDSNEVLGGDGGPTVRRVQFTSARDIRSEAIRWLWRPRLPLRSLSVIAGEKGLGKSILTNARLVAEATRGDLVGELHGQPIDVLICTAEDDWRSVVKPRLMAHNATLDRVHRVTVADSDGEALLTLPDDVSLLEGEIHRLRSQGRTVGMLVIDPISAFMSEATDTHRDSSVRRALAPLAAMAERLDLVVVVVAHLTKDDSSRLIHRVSGSGAFVNAARSVLVLAPSPDDPDGEQGQERVLVHVRGNWGRPAPTLAARVEGRDVDLDDGTQTSVGYMEITGESDIAPIASLTRGVPSGSRTCDADATRTAALTFSRRSLPLSSTVRGQAGRSRHRSSMSSAAASERSNARRSAWSVTVI